MLLDRTLACGGDCGDLFDTVAVKVVQRDGRAFLGWQGAQGKVEILMFEGGIGGCAADERSCLIDAVHRAATRLVAEEGIVSDLEKPRTELPFILIASQREVCLDQGILGQVVGITLVAAAQGEQEASQGLLLALDMRYEYFAGHPIIIVVRPFFSPRLQSPWRASSCPRNN